MRGTGTTAQQSRLSTPVHVQVGPERVSCSTVPVLPYSNRGLQAGRGHVLRNLHNTENRGVHLCYIWEGARGYRVRLGRQVGRSSQQVSIRRYAGQPPCTVQVL